MPAEIFYTLGIEPTSDQKAIRRAYAVALKRIDQAADPEGFAALRIAFEHARAWAERELASDAVLHRPGATPADAGWVRPHAPNQEPVADVQTPQTEFSEVGALASEPQTDPHAQQASAAQAGPQPSREELDEAIAHWTHQLMHAPDEQVAQLLDSALADIRLGHLEARDGLAISLARALHEQPNGRLALFNTARRVFDWNGFSEPLPNDAELSGWVAMLVDQIEHYGHLPLRLRVRLDAVLIMARKLSGPNLMQALWHGESFEQLLSHAPDLSVLDLGQARILAWRRACARVAYIRSIRRWATENWVKLALAVVCAIGLALMYQDARDGTTYKKPPATRAQLSKGVVTVQAIRSAPEAQPCAVSQVFSRPLGCHALQPHETPDAWPTAVPSTLVITQQPDMPYPYEARLRALKGKVWVRVLLDEQGRVQRSAVQFSSGSDVLDNAAVTASVEVRLMPAMQNGSAIPSQALLMFDYAVEAP